MNILFLMADQINVRALGAYGGRHIQTPHLDRLAHEGALFENACCSWPVSSPSRASIFTGQYAHTHGITRNVDTPDLPSITNDMPFTENVLCQAGFATYYIGRWHIGPRESLDCFKGRVETPVRRGAVPPPDPRKAPGIRACRDKTVHSRRICTSRRSR